MTLIEISNQDCISITKKWFKG